MAAVNLIGLDIGSVSIRAVETSSGKDGPVITNFGQMPLPPGVVQSGVVQDEQAVTGALKQLWATAKFRSRKVALGVTNPQIVVREMSVANLPAKEMRKSLPFQVRDALPLAAGEVTHRLLPPGGARRRRRPCGGCSSRRPRTRSSPRSGPSRRRSLHVVRVDLASFALLRAASRLDEQVEAIVDIGAQATSVIVHADGEPLIVRTIPRGGNEITETIADRLDVPIEQAEALKCRIGLHTDDRPADRVGAQGRGPAAHQRDRAARSRTSPPPAGRPRSAGSPCPAAARCSPASSRRCTPSCMWR